MKKLITAVLVAFILAAMCSCSIMDILPEGLITRKVIEPQAKKEYLTVEPDALSYTKGYEPISPKHSYEALPKESEQTLYEGLMSVYYDISDEMNKEAGLYPMPQVRVDAALTEAEVRTVIKAIYDDNPELFWTSGTVGYYSSGEETVVQLYSKYSPKEIDDKLAVLHKAANSFYATVPDGLSEYERELLVHDFIVDLVDYDKDVDPVNTDRNDPDIYTVYGALVNKLAVCEGYARAFQLLLNGIGVDCVSISGYAGESELHMWNAVGFNDKWYAVDVTWDDSDAFVYKYAFFNLTTEQMAYDHEPSPMFTELTEDEINGLEGDINCDVMNMFVPECSDNSMGYYYRTAPRFTDYNGDGIESTLLTAALARDETYIFYVDDKFDFEEVTSNLFINYPQYFFDYIKNVNNNISNYSIDSSHIGYFPYKNLRIIAVELKYY